MHTTIQSPTVWVLSGVGQRTALPNGTCLAWGQAHHHNQSPTVLGVEFLYGIGLSTALIMLIMGSGIPP